MGDPSWTLRKQLTPTGSVGLLRSALQYLAMPQVLDTGRVCQVRMLSTKITSASVFAPPVVLVLGDAANEDAITVERKRLSTTAIKMHLTTARPALIFGYCERI
jgi:hypothetical protein